MLVAVAILTYSSLVYFAEKEGLETFGDVNCSLYINSSASKLPGHPCYSWTFLEAFWWGLMTITTVGYDLNPRLLPAFISNCSIVGKLFVFRSFFGKFIAGFCALSGVFILTLPIPIVVNSFANFYKNRLWRNEVELRKQERLRLKAIQERQTQKYQFIEVKVMSCFKLCTIIRLISLS